MKAAAVVTNLSGGVFLVRNGQETALEAGTELLVTDGVRTGLDGKAELHFADGTEVALGVMSQVEIRDFAYDPSGQTESSFAMHMMEGVVRTVTGEVVKLNPEGFSLSTPLGTAGIRGTTVIAQIFPTHVVFMVTDMGQNKYVVVNSVFGGDLTIYQPGTGAEITLTGQEKINFLDAIPDDMRDAVQQLLSGVYDDERSSHDDPFIVLGDAEFLAALGVADVGRGVGLLSVDDAEIIVNLLQELGVDQPEFFLEAEFADKGPSIIYWEGTPDDDVYVGQFDHDHHLQAYAGNDNLVVFNGNDTVYGGNNSTDKIMKVTTLMASGTYLYGGEESLTGPGTLDNDSITVRGPAASDPVPDAAADAADYWRNFNDWTAAEMTGGEIYGSAGLLSGYTGGGVNTISLYGNMSGGAMYGKAGSMADCDFSNSASYIYINAPGAGDGNMTGGAVYGDAYTMNNSEGGKGYIGIKGSLGGSAAIYGDAYQMDASSTGGMDTLKVEGNMTGGVIYGDAANMAGGTGGQDNITILGNMTGGTIYGDAHYLDGGTADGDQIIIDGTMSGGAIYTDAATGTYTAAAGGQPNRITVTTMTGGTVYGGACEDNIRVDHFSGGTFNPGMNNLTLLTVSDWTAGSTLKIGAVSGSLGLSAMAADANAATIEVGALKVGSYLSVGDNLTNKTVIIAEQQGGGVNVKTDPGNNTLIIEKISGDISVASSKYSVTALQAGARLTSTTFASDITLGGMGAGSTVITGMDADAITVTGNIGAGSVIDAGDGLNQVEVKGVMTGSKIITGADNDDITVNSLSGDNIIDAGTGTNNIDITTLGSGTAEITGGINAVTVTNFGGGGTLDFSGSSQGSTLEITSVLSGGGTVVGVASVINQVDIGSLAAGTLTLGGDYDTQYDVSIAGVTSGILAGGLGKDTITVDDNARSGMAGGALTGGGGVDSIKVVGDLQGSLSGDFSNAGEDSNGIYGRDTLLVDGDMAAGAVVYGDAWKASSIVRDEGMPYDNYMGDSIGVVGDVLAGAVIYGDAQTISLIKMGESRPMGDSDNFMSDTITVNGDLYGTIYGDAEAVTSLYYRGKDSGSGGVAPTGFMADSITVTGTMKDGSVIHGDANLSGATVQFDAGSGFVGVGTPEWHAAFGCDTIVVGAIDGGSIYSSYGNDSIKVVGNFTKGTIDGGTGNNHIEVGGTMGNALDGLIHGGSDNDFILLGKVSGGAVYGWGGNDTILVGTGWNGVTLSSPGVMDGGVMRGGDGNDSIRLGTMSGGTINGDGGNDTITVSGTMNDGTINGGDGNDKIEVEHLICATLDGGTINGGSGNDSILVGDGGMHHGTIYGGDGNDEIEVKLLIRGDIYGGNGDDSILVRNMAEGSVDTVMDDEGVPVLIFPGVKINTGDGNDSVYVDAFSRKDYWTYIELGAGDDYLYIGSMAKESGKMDIYLGDGSKPSECDVIRLGDFDGTVGPGDGATATFNVYGFTGSSQVFYDTNTFTISTVDETDGWQVTLTSSRGVITLLLGGYHGLDPEDQFYKDGGPDVGEHRLLIDNLSGASEFMTVGADIIEAAGMTGSQAADFNFGHRAGLNGGGDGMQDTFSLNGGFTLGGNYNISLQAFDVGKDTVGGTAVYDKIQYDSNDWNTVGASDISNESITLTHNNGYKLTFVLNGGTWTESIMNNVFELTNGP